MPQTLHIDWPANPASELVHAYRVFRTLDGVGPDVVGTVTTNHFEVANPSPGVHSYRIQALNFVGESALSPAANGPGVPSTPSQPTLTIVVS